MSRSRAPYSNQAGPHPDLEKVVRRHLESEYCRPIPTTTREVFERLRPCVEQHDGALILDAGCGNGHSCAVLAERFPHALVIGVDKSPRRLQGHLDGQAFMHRGQLILCRANLIDFWRLAASAGWRLSRHYLLYPNPWPKKQHLQRRWHGHSVLPTILALGGRLEVRSNWRDYILEFAQALSLAGANCDCGALPGDDPLTPFEKKYHHSGHGLYYCVCRLAPDAACTVTGHTSRHRDMQPAKGEGRKGS